MPRRLPAFAALAVLLLAAAPVPHAAASAVDSLAGFDSAANMKSWLKLTDEQVAKLTPVIDTRITSMDAAIAKADTAEKPDALGFIGEYGAIKKQFDAGVTAILTPDQLKQWDSFKAAMEKDLVQEGAHRQLLKLQPALKLTDEQVAKLVQPMVTATQGKVDVLQKLAASGRIGVRDKLQAKRSMEGINDNFVKAMSAVCSPEQVSQYQAIQAAKKQK